MAGVGSRPGERRGGRKKGTPNHVTTGVREKILALGDKGPVEYLIMTMQNRVPCGKCRGKGKTPYQPGGGREEPRLRKCQSCWGSKLEQIPPRERQDAASDLMGYIAPKLKAIEHSMDEGTIEGLADILRQRRAKRENIQ